MRAFVLVSLNFQPGLEGTKPNSFKRYLESDSMQAKGETAWQLREVEGELDSSDSRTLRMLKKWRGSWQKLASVSVLEMRSV